MIATRRQGPCWARPRRIASACTVVLLQFKTGMGLDYCSFRLYIQLIRYPAQRASQGRRPHRRPVMQSFPRILTMALSICLVLVSCTSAPSTPAPSPLAVASSTPADGVVVVKGSTITAREPGQTVKLKVGDTLEVRIPTIPRSGFTWQPQKLNTSILEQLGDPVYEPDTSPNAAGGTVIVRFKAVGPGTAPLTLAYVGAPSGGGLSLSSDTFGLTVNVE